MTDCGHPYPVYDNDTTCIRCHYASLGMACVKCGSPWIYIETEQGTVLCKPCMSRTISDHDLLAGQVKISQA